MVHQEVGNPDCNCSVQSMTIKMMCTVPTMLVGDIEFKYKLYLKLVIYLPTQKEELCNSVRYVNWLLTQQQIGKDATNTVIGLASDSTGKHWSLSVWHVSQFSE